MITLQQLDIFIEAVRAGSFRRCADHLGVSVVAVSKHIRALEAALGTALFERRAGMMPALTEFGRGIYDRAIVIVADVADLQRQNSDARGNGRRRISMAVHTYLMRNLPEEVARCHQEWPDLDVEIDLAVRTNEEFAERVARRELDVAYCFALSEDDLPGSRFIRNEPLGIYVGMDHPLAQRELVTLDELGREPSVQLTATEPLSLLIDRIFAGWGLTRRQVGLRTDQFGLIVASLHHCRGYSVLFAEGSEASGEALGLVRVRMEVPIPPLQVRRITRRSSHDDARLRELLARIEAVWGAD